MIRVDSDFIRKTIRTVPDWPEKGVMFRDITPIFQNPIALRGTMDAFIHRYFEMGASMIAGVDARGFLLGVTIAYGLNLPFVPIRKKGKLPWKTIEEEYELEYGKATVELHADAVKAGDRVVIFDDLIATGGTMLAAAQLIQRLGAEIIEASAIVDLPELGGSKKLRDAGLSVFTLVEFEGA
ncbi:MAG: adenine phosphoribosyltransferase [Spirochaetales bacterium]|nr:adenine phosphoribosyltransferase [Leptospiraceae bacterium]MCP5481684.1 adenine phosphoribosyltransferase [Spirochaetales bacterium]